MPDLRETLVSTLGAWTNPDNQDISTLDEVLEIVAESGVVRYGMREIDDPSTAYGLELTRMRCFANDRRYLVFELPDNDGTSQDA